MAVTPDHPAPYQPGSVTTDLLERYRSRGLPAPINADVLRRAGVSDSLIPRTIQGLQTLDLIDDSGQPTTVFEGLRLAPEAEYKTRVAEWLRAAYADALHYIDPETADETAIRDAFRQYTPVGQQPRMITLFTALFRYAGIGPEKPAVRIGTIKEQIRQSRRPPGSLTLRPRQRRETPPSPPPPPAFYGGEGSPHPAISGLLAGLPKTWTQADKDRFLTAFGAVLDLSVRLVADAPAAEPAGGADAPG
jgi:hypothetical protein